MIPRKTTLTVWAVVLIVNRYNDKAWLLTVDDAGKVLERYNRFAERIVELGIQQDVDAKPILDVSPLP